MANNIQTVKITELPLRSPNDMSGKEVVPFSILGATFGATLESLQTYFGDSALQFFSRIVDGFVSVGGQAPDLTEGTIEIVYLTYYKAFMLAKTVNGLTSYYAAYDQKLNYMNGTEVRTDRAFLNLSDKGLYLYDGAKLADIFSTLRINVMTEDELNKLTNPVEGAIYATYE